MAKDPAFLFYSRDFLVEAIDMTNEECGQYIRLLCLQHQKGHLSEKTIRFCVGDVPEVVMGKFEKDEEGLYFNRRLDEESRKREQFISSRQNNGKKGGRPSNKKTTRFPLGDPTENLLANANANANEDNNSLNEENPVKKNSTKQRKEPYAEFVKLTLDEHDKLVAEHGEEDTRQLITILDNYKGASGKKYQSDYRAILNWVVKRLEEDKLSLPKGIPKAADYGGEDFVAEMGWSDG